MAKRKHFDYCRAMTQSSDIRIISKKKLAEMLGVSTTTIYRMTKNGLLPPPMRSREGYISGWLLGTIKVWRDNQ